MTLATTPTSQITATPHFAQIADARWRYWRGAVAVWLAGAPYPSLMPTATFLQRDHRAWILVLLSRGIPLSAIRRLNLDDPRESISVLADRVESYTQRKRRYHNEPHTR
jgi:hypothetical protein